MEALYLALHSSSHSDEQRTSEAHPCATSVIVLIIVPTVSARRGSRSGLVCCRTHCPKVCQGCHADDRALCYTTSVAYVEARQPISTSVAEVHATNIFHTSTMHLVWHDLGPICIVSLSCLPESHDLMVLRSDMVSTAMCESLAHDNLRLVNSMRGKSRR